MSEENDKYVSPSLPTPQVNGPPVFEEARRVHAEVKEVMEPMPETLPDPHKDSEPTPEPKPEPIADVVPPSPPRVLDFELKLTEIDVQSGSIPVTWCLSKEWLDNNSIKDWYVMFVVAPISPDGGSAEYRGYARLSDMMAYVTFFRPGKNRIYARLTKSKSTVYSWMERREGKWRDNVITYPRYDLDMDKVKGGTWEYQLSGAYSDSVESSIDVDMPKECFAGEPWDIEKAWVNWLFTSKAVDQCEFRKRRMFAYTIQPLVFMFFLFFNILTTLVLTLCGCKGVNYSVMFHPLSSSWFDISSGISGSYYALPYEPPAKYVLMPIPPMMLFAFLLGFVTKGFKFGLLLGLLPLGVVCIVTLAAFIAYLMLKIPLFYMLDRTIGRWISKFIEESDKAAQLREVEYNKVQREFLSCSSRIRIKSLSDLPKPKRSIKLRFQGLKSMVCKPFSR